MLISRAYHQLTFEIAADPGNRSVCYVLLPQGAVSEVGKWADKASAELGCNIVLISGMDWNNDMTPWPADGVMKKEKSFGGGAGVFVKSLLEDYVPNIERWLKLELPKRYIIGVSLSGLFALWLLFRTDRFDGLASVSGSLWYDGLVEWVSRNEPASASRLYLSLGVKEKQTPDKRMARVEDCTNAIADLLKAGGQDVVYEMVPGTHFSPLAPKLGRALAAMMA